MNTHKRVMLFGILLLTVVFSQFNIVQAQSSASEKMVGLLPDDVIVFATTSGGDALKPDFDKTVLGNIWKMPAVQTFYQSIEQKLTQKVQDDPDLDASVLMESVPNMPVSADFVMSIAEVAKMVVPLVGSRPIIIGVAQKDTQDMPPVYGFAFIDGGEKTGEMKAYLENLEEKAGGGITEIKVGSHTFHGPKNDGGVPGYWGWIGNYFVFAVNDGEGTAIKYFDSDVNRKSPTYFQKSSITNDAFAFYLNFEKVMDISQMIVPLTGQSSAEFELVKTMMSQFGLDKFKSVTNRTGFSGSEIVMEEFVEIDQPQTGLLGNLKPVSVDMFNMASPDAVSVSAMNCDMAGIYDTILKAAKAVIGEEFEEIEQGIAQMENQMQFKVRDGLLESLNGKMLVYEIPGSSSQPINGFVMVLGLKDVQLWKDSIETISNLAVTMSNNMVQLSSQEVEGRELNTIAIVPLAVAQVMPTWTIVGDNVVIASSPAICIAAAEQAAPAGRSNSIRNNERFQKATAKLPSGVLNFHYADTREQMTQIAAVIQQYWPVATMYLGQMGIEDLPVVLPDVSSVIKKVTPSIQYTWIDEKGIHSISKGSGLE